VKLADVVAATLLSDVSAMSVCMASNIWKQLTDDFIQYTKVAPHLKWSPQDWVTQAPAYIRAQGLRKPVPHFHDLVVSVIEHDEPIQTELDWIVRLTPPE